MTFDLHTFTLIHVVLSLVGIIAGLAVAGGLVAGRYLHRWAGLFLLTTTLTNMTGFGFPFTAVRPPHVVGAVSLIVLAICLLARYWKRLEGRWRTTYVVTAVVALYLNVFVLVAQLFAKTPSLVQLAPTQQEPPFAATQLLVLALFVWLGRAAVRGFRSTGPA